MLVLKFSLLFGTKNVVVIFTRVCQLSEGFKQDTKHQKKTEETVLFHVRTIGRIVDLE
jgi:hypothetical protein